MPILIDGEIVLYGAVGESYWESYFTANDVVMALAELGSDTDVTVRINSGGGVALDGVAIYNALKAHKGKVTVSVDGIAASAASVIAMAGDEVIMRRGSVMMIHDPSTWTYGNIQEHEKNLQALDKIGAQLASIYAAKTGDGAADIRNMMREETWLSAEEAVNLKFADKHDDQQAMEASAFDYRVYSKAPFKFKALAKANAWMRPEASATINDVKPTTEPISMPEKNQPSNESVTANVSERTRIQSILNSEEAKGRDDLAKHFAFNTSMSAEDALAALKVAPQAQSDAGAITASGDANLLGLELAGAPQATANKSKPKINASEIFAKRRAALQK